MKNNFIKKIIENNLENKIKLFKSFSSYETSLFATIPIIFNKETNIDIFIENNIEAKKYYYPLENKEKSRDIFDRIICLPLNMEVGETEIDRYIEIINKYFTNPKYENL